MRLFAIDEVLYKTMKDYFAHVWAVLFYLLPFFTLFSCEDDLVEANLLMHTQYGDAVFIREQDHRPVLSRNDAEGRSYFVNENKVLSDPIPSVIRTSSSGNTLLLRDGRTSPFLYELLPDYPYEEYPIVRNYHEPKYEVDSLNHDVSYASAEGFWCSDPDKDQDFFTIYLDNLPNLITSKTIQDLTMDVYLPSDDDSARRPLFVIIHGGAFYIGDKQDNFIGEICSYMASLGYVAATINYRIGFYPLRSSVEKAGYQALQDADAAIRYLVNNAQKYHVDPDRVFVAGTSAGAITALNVAYMKEANAPRGALGECGSIHAVNGNVLPNYTVRAIGNLWGGVRDIGMLMNERCPVVSFQSKNDPVLPYTYGAPFTETFKYQNTAISAIDEWLPDNLISKVRGLTDGIAVEVAEFFFDNMYGAYEIDRKLKELGTPSALYTYTDKVHTLTIEDAHTKSARFNEIRDRMAYFFYKNMDFDVNLQWSRLNECFVTYDSRDIDECVWKIEGGVILDEGESKMRILLFSDCSEHSVTISGRYTSGNTFTKRVEIEI